MPGVETDMATGLPVEAGERVALIRSSASVSSRTMSASSSISLSVATANLNIARMWPCSAFVMPGIACGATPASKYLRFCGVQSHSRTVWLCPVHAGLVICGGAICKECAQRGGISRFVSIERLTEPIRLP